MRDYWLENAAQSGRHTLVDCGPVVQAEAIYKRLRAHLGRARFQRVGNGRLVACIPPRKVAEVLAAVPEIKAGAQGYCWCTHGVGEVR